MKEICMKRSWNLVLLALALFLATVFYIDTNAAAKIEKVKYDGNGKVEVDFTTDVRYKKVKVSVKDDKGKSKKVTILERDDDELDFKISGYKAGKKYSFTISGIRRWDENSFSSVSGSVKIPKASNKIPIEEIEYDGEDREVSFDFIPRVSWNSPTVTITKGKKNYVNYIQETDDDGIEVRVKKLKRGVKYNYKITGIKKRGTNKYITIKGTFTP